MSNDLTHYASLLDDVKTRIRQAQTKAVFSANAELILLYWDIGRMIHQRQKREGWGAAVIPRLARDIRNDLPEMKGFSERNLKRMIRFYREYPGLSKKCHKLWHNCRSRQQMKKCHDPWHFWVERQSNRICNSLLQNFPGGITSFCLRK